MVCMQSTLMTVTVAGEWAGWGGFLVVVRTHFVGQPPAEVKKQLFVLLLKLQIEEQSLSSLSSSSC